jgi:Zn-dependent peptidase ImmA (M78 family)/transcriptional regulator with XRE-family HTH domain
MSIRLSQTSLVLARESRSLTQGELARKAGITQGTVSKLEHGLIAADEATLVALCEALQYPAEFFTSDFETTELPAVFYRKKARIRVVDERAIRAKVNIMRRSVALLLRGVELPEYRVPAIDLSKSTLHPALVARELRAQWGIPSGPIESVTMLLERAGVPVIKFDFGVSTVDGVSVYQGDGAPPMVFINTHAPGDRMRFTLAHELAHIIFHHHMPVPSEDAEDEANEFAAELMAPAADIRPYLLNLTLEKLASLKRHWRLSMACLLKRAEDVERVSEYKARLLWKNMSRLGYRTQEPVAVPQEELTLVPEVIRVHVEELGYSEEDLHRVMWGDFGAVKLRPPKLRAVQ